MNKSSFLNLYKTMLKIRLTEEKIADEYKYGKMRCPTHLSIGQELAPGCIAEFVNNDDYAISTHRSHAHYISKGGNLKKMIAEIYGKVTGCSKGKGGSMHLIDLNVNFMGSTAIVGNSIPVGVGLAYAAKIKKQNRISIIFLGEGATEQGVFYESLNFAILKDLPVLFICENNLYSVYSSLKVRQPKDRKIFKMTSSMGIQSNYSKGLDFRDTYKKTSEAFKYIRNKNKPYFLEVLTYRHREHCGPNFDNDLGYRKKSEYLKWKDQDPIIKLEKYIFKNFHRDKINLLKKNIIKDIDIAFDFAKTSKYPKNIKSNFKIFA